MLAFTEPNDAPKQSQIMDAIVCAYRDIGPLDTDIDLTLFDQREVVWFNLTNAAITLYTYGLQNLYTEIIVIRDKLQKILDDEKNIK